MRFKESEIFFSWTYPFWIDFFLHIGTNSSRNVLCRMMEWKTKTKTTTRRTKKIYWNHYQYYRMYILLYMRTSHTTSSGSCMHMHSLNIICTIFCKCWQAPGVFSFDSAFFIFLLHWTLLRSLSLFLSILLSQSRFLIRLIVFPVNIPILWTLLW